MARMFKKHLLYFLRIKYVSGEALIGELGEHRTQSYTSQGTLSLYAASNYPIGS